MKIENNYITITTAYTSRFGVPAVGARVFVSVNANVDGYEGIPLVFSARVPAAALSLERGEIGPSGRMSVWGAPSPPP